MVTNYSKDIRSENLSIKADELPDEYFSVIVEPAGTWLSPNWAELWEHRELFYFLTLRDIKIRYKQTFLGIAWVLLQPTISTIVFSILFTNLGQSNPLNIPYPLFASSGFIVALLTTVTV